MSFQFTMGFAHVAIYVLTFCLLSVKTSALALPDDCLADTSTSAHEFAAPTSGGEQFRLLIAI